MATITLTADTDYSALTVANDDTIDCAGFILTLDEQPTETGVQVTSPATNGRVVFSGGWNLSTWDFFAGSSTSAGMINTLPSGAVIRSITAGAVSNAYGVGTNNGTIEFANGGSGSAAIAVNSNNGTITTVSAGSNGIAFGVNTNGVNGVITTANGGTANNTTAVSANNGRIITANAGGFNGSNGCGTNSGTIDAVNGGSVSGAHGCGTNNGTILASSGGTHASASGVFINNGQCLRLTDSTGKAVANWTGSLVFVEGPFVNGVIPNNIKTIYSLGTLSGSATIAGDADVITLSEGTGGSPRPVNPFTQQVIG